MKIWGKNLPLALTEPNWDHISWFRRVKLKRKPCEVPSITPFLLNSTNPSPVVILAPGGGYGGRADHEGKPIAEWLNSIGFSAFVLNYRHFPFHHPIPFLDAQRAVRYVRYNAPTFHILPEQMGMLGFSAGGHLTATMGNFGDRNFFPEGYTQDEIDSVSAKLNYMVLCYPVISFTQFHHMGSIRNLLGKNVDINSRAQLSAELQVNSNTPPTFLWSTLEDTGVPYQNSELFATALRKQRTPVELHVFKTGGHGLGLGTQNPEVAQWTNLCRKWLYQIAVRG